MTKPSAQELLNEPEPKNHELLHRQPLKDEVEAHFAGALTGLGAEIDNDHRKDTPRRMARAFRELLSGYQDDPREILSRTFPMDGVDQMVVVRHIPYWSLCEHHCLPFHGTVTVGYLPRDGVCVGLSKIPRLVQCFARRLQTQESMTEEIARNLALHLAPIGVGVLVSGQHTCMQMRGVRSSGEMLTSCMLGAFRSQPEARAEFLAVARG